MALEVKLTAGKILARRMDGEPMTPQDWQEAKKLAEEAGAIPGCCWNCGEPWSLTRDIYGAPVFVCWACAKTA